MENSKIQSKINSPMPVKVDTLELLLDWFMIDGEVSLPNPENKALTLVIRDGGYQVGIASLNESGYQPANITIDRNVYEDACEIIDQANKVIFKRTALESHKIVSSSFRKQWGKQTR